MKIKFRTNKNQHLNRLKWKRKRWFLCLLAPIWCRVIVWCPSNRSQTSKSPPSTEYTHTLWFDDFRSGWLAKEIRYECAECGYVVLMHHSKAPWRNICAREYIGNRSNSFNNCITRFSSEQALQSPLWNVLINKDSLDCSICQQKIHAKTRIVGAHMTFISALIYVKTGLIRMLFVRDILNFR